MTSPRYIYLRSLPCQVKAGLYGKKDLPVGCLAYQDINGYGKFAYGLSFFNTEVDGFVAEKKEARRVADARLLLALQGDERKKQQGRWGFIETQGDSLNERVANMIEVIIQDATLHADNGVHARIVSQLESLVNRLLSARKKTKAA